MPGSGAGPPRKSHTKSRNGCRTCKRRHIRCDETFPQCRNCTKHSCRCDYMDTHSTRENSNPIPPITAPPLSLMVTPEIDVEIEHWRTSGIPPWPELSICRRDEWLRFPKSTLRLIYHISALSIDLNRRGLGEVTVWSTHISRLLAIAVTSEFVMSSVLAFSALHMAHVTDSKETLSLSHHYRNVASEGLQSALGSFSKENCDAILAAYLVLSWQAADWNSIYKLQKGILPVLDSMHPSWKESSHMAQILESQRLLRSFTTSPNGNPNRRIQYMNVENIIVELQKCRERLQYLPQLHNALTELMDFVKQIHSEIPFEPSHISFTRLQTLRTWIFWLPTKLLRDAESEPGALAVLAHFYSVALILEPFFLGLEGAYFGCMALNTIGNIDLILNTRQTNFPSAHTTQLANALMDTPRHVAKDYKTSIQWSSAGLRNHTVNQMFPTSPSPYEYPATPFVASGGQSTYTSNPISPFPHMITTSPPLQAPIPYRSSGNFSSSFYMSPPGPPTEYYEDSLSDYSRPGTIEHSPAFSSYGNEYLHHGLPTADPNGASFHPAQIHAISGAGSNSIPTAFGN